MQPERVEKVQSLLATALSLEGPSLVRFPRGTLPEVPPALSGTSSAPVHGARWVRRVPGARGTFLTLGPLALCALEAAERLPEWNVLDARFVSPLDEAAVLEAAATGHLVVAEEGTTRGGLGGAVLELLAAGVRVLGAASLGAIRAAELAPCGMEGVGLVYALYAAGLVRRDDAVMRRAIIRAPSRRHRAAPPRSHCASVHVPPRDRFRARPRVCDNESRMNLEK